MDLARVLRNSLQYIMRLISSFPASLDWRASRAGGERLGVGQIVAHHESNVRRMALADEMARAQTCVPRRRDVRQARRLHQQDRRSRGRLLELSQYLLARYVGEVVVQHDEVERARAQPQKRFAPTPSSRRLVAFVFEQRLKCDQHTFVVVDQ